MALHFSRDEFAERCRRACAALAAEGLDGLLMFRQESMFYLTGYDTFGYVFFQCLVLTADGRMTLLTRAPDLRQARHTSTLTDIRIWTDRAGANPAEQLADILLEQGLSGGRLGVEYEAYGLTARSGRMVDAAIGKSCTLVDASEIVSKLRVIKSKQEIAYVRRAAALADDALDAAVALTAPGAYEGDILAAMQGAVFAGGGDYPGNEFIIGSGRDALLCRYFTGRRHLDAQDQMTLEFAGVYRHYHACLMRTILVGKPDSRHLALYDACREALEASEATVAPGNTMGAVFAAHAAVMDGRGFAEHRLNACGYSLGATYAPNWMDWPMFYQDNPAVIAPGMVLFLHMVLMDSASERAMTLGRTVLVTETGSAPLSKASIDLIAV